MMGFIHVAVAVLSLLSVVQSAPVTSCESLIKPLNITGREPLLGKWWQVAESTDFTEMEEIIKKFRESFWTKISAANESDAMTVLGISKAFGICITTAMKMTLENNTIHPVVSTLSLQHSPQPGVSLLFFPVNLLKSGCSDCLLVQSTGQIFARTFRVLRLLSKRRTVTAAEMEEFKKQAECLNLPQPYILSPEGGVCPEPAFEDTEITDMPLFFINGQMMEFMNLTEKIANSKGGPEKFREMLLDVLPKND